MIHFYIYSVPQNRAVVQSARGLLYGAFFAILQVNMETKFNKKVQKHRRRWFREDWQEKLPVRQVFLFAALLLLVLLILWINEPSLSALHNADLDLVRAKGSLHIGVDENLFGLNVQGQGLEDELAAALSRFLFEDTESCQTVGVTRQTAQWKMADGLIDLAAVSMSGFSSREYTATTVPFYTDAVVLVGYGIQPLSEKRVAALKDTDAYKVLTRYQQDEEPTLSVLPYAAYYDMLVALRAGTVDYCAMPRTAALTFMDEDMRLCPGNIGTVQYHLVAPASEKALLSLLDALLVQWAQDGTLRAWYEKYDLLYEQG